ncbi:Molybdenum ABC transporter ATP-binding protein [Methylocella tundrae]|uniref:Molybdenum ABC transporter ATP-binding protein n=1 Tax=Methylocella tundrae TaxID=227605 RepID=A0A8B6M3V0_METTU|nr:DUF2478 domain-containing protein [Methylocella tundrae]VTZ49508.1 Molybdenum ABC transporter ATP-binding protein [Methylocella tundrae]
MSGRVSSDVNTLAALVFEDSEAANGIVEAFARDVSLAGHRIGGVIQIADATQACDCRDTLLYDVETGERVSILQDLGRQSQSCRVDTSAIAHAAHLIATALERSPDLLFINRFGKLEIEGNGLLSEIGAAAVAGIPTLVCVPARFLEAWRRFTMGFDEELPCSAEALQQWWSAVKQRSAPTPVSIDASSG